MGDLVIPQWHPLDLVSPVEAALRLHDARENAKTQRMFAENSMRRESAEEARRQKEFDEKQVELKRTHGIEQATALGTLGQMARSGRTGEAQALAQAYGIDFHPLLGPASAAQAPTVDQQIDRELAGSRDGAPPPEAAPPGPVYEGPAESPELEERRARPDDSLEGLMSAAAPEHAPPPEHPAVMPPTMFEAAIGPNKYQIDALPRASGLGEKYDAVFNDLVANGMPADKAREFVLKEKLDADKQAGIGERMAALLGQRNAETEKLRSQYDLTAEQKQGNVETAETGRNKRATESNSARITAAGIGAHAREDANRDKKEDKEDATSVRDESGAVIGHVPTGRGGAQGFATRDADYGRAIDQLQALADHIEKHGNRVGPAEAKARDTLYNNAAIALRRCLRLGKQMSVSNWKRAQSATLERRQLRTPLTWRSAPICPP